MKNRNKKTLHDYIVIAGGATYVSKKCGISRRTIYRWANNGFPDSEYSGRTNYAVKLSHLCSDMLHKVSAKHLLKIGRPNVR